tara:strand:+ start:2554 stop:4146 length:1593 start_codon:yes stop_codon:yes gene_type:complete
MAIKRYVAAKDNTITNAFNSTLLASQRGTGSNMGAADVLEIFSIYGQASGSNGLSAELSRAILQFPIDSITSDRSAGTIPASGSVSFYLNLYNARHVYTLPRNYNLVVKSIATTSPSSSWEEGVGLDMEEYTDKTYNNSGSNWIQARMSSAAGNDNGKWVTPGGDYYQSTAYHQYNVSFPEGYEDMTVDITGMVEDWLAGTITNYGLGIHLTASQETKFDPAAATNVGSQNSLLYNPTGSTESYYTKKFFSRSSEFFFKRPVLEARWDSRTKDDRGSFYLSSSLATAADNLNTLYLYNYVRGKLTDIPGLQDQHAGYPIWVSVYSGSSAPTGSKLLLPSGGGVLTATQTEVTGGWVSTGLYTASFGLTGTLSKAFDVWHLSGTVFATSSFAPLPLKIYNNAPTQEYVTACTNLKAAYTPKETSRFRFFVREKGWSPNIYTVATSQVPNQSIQSASYMIYRIVDDLRVVPFGTGSNKQTYMSYDVSGNYFDFEVSMLEKDYAYGIKVAYYNDSIGDWAEQPEVFKFRVEEA